MLYAKISPVATFTQSTGPFTAPTATQAEFITASARPYQAGAAKTRFEITFGNVKPSDQASAVNVFTQVSNTSVELTAEELAAWGTDDTILLSIIATKLGTTATEFVTIAGGERY
jgi:hypothetical protein